MTLEEWRKLPLCGYQFHPWGEYQELRNCTCGSTLAISSENTEHYEAFTVRLEVKPKLQGEYHGR
jgi:hypothetical protein